MLVINKPSINGPPCWPAVRMYYLNGPCPLRKIQNSLLFSFLPALSIVLLLLTGCTISPVQIPLPLESRAYHSDLAEPQAKALYAYVEFRMLAAENRWDDAIEALRRAVAFDPETEYLGMALAKALLHKNQAEASIEILQQILTQSPDNIEGHELLGDLLSYQERDEEAIEHYRHALTGTPGNEMLQMRLAMALGRLERTDEAILLLEGLVAEQPEAKLARLALARFYQERGQLEKAEATYQDLLQQHPNQQQAFLEYGRMLEAQGLFAEAFALYRQGIKQNPQAAAIRQQLAMLYLKQSRNPEALEQLLAVRQLLPENLQVVGQIGLLHLKMEAWLQAEEDFRSLLQHGENAGRNRYYLGLALLGQEKYQAAIATMAPIDESSPIFAEAVMQLAYLYRQAGQFEPAIASLKRVLAEDIQQPEIYYYLISFLGDSGDQDQAAEVVATGLSHFPDNVELLFQSALIAEKQGDREKALAQMEKILSIDANFPDALNFIAYHYAEKGTDLDLALIRAQKALMVKPSGYIIDTLGWIYFKMGRYPESREQLEEASSLLPDDPVILEHLGDLYRALTLNEKAADAYRKALELDPLADGVEDKLQRLPLEMP